MTEVGRAASGNPTRSTEVLAFASPAGGSGQTSIVANTAWVLAQVGKRVLVLDWGTSAPFVGDYLRPFRVDDRAVTEPLSAALQVLVTEESQVARLRLEHVMLPGGADIDVVAVASTLGAEPVLAQATGHGARLRQLLRGTDYDYVLLDCPSPAPPGALAQLAQLCDGIAVCFRSHSRIVPAAVRMVRDLGQRAPSPLRLVAVPTQMGLDRHRVREQLKRIQDQLVRQSGETYEQRVQPTIVEMPNHSYDVFEEVLAIVLDEGAMRRALLRVVGVLTAGAVDDMAPVDPLVRARYERGFGDDESAPTDTVHLVYDPVDRRWADWITRQLRRVGVVAARPPRLDTWVYSAADPQLVIVGDRALRQPSIRQLAEQALAIGPNRLIRIRVDDEVAPPVAPQARMLLLAGRDEAAAKASLLAFLGVVDTGSSGPVETFVPRFPDSPDRYGNPLVTNAPPRNPLFSGRSADLEALRDLLLQPVSGATALVGGPGVGKSELAREYAHRFADDYDVIWWIPAQNEESVNAALRPLSSKLRGLRRGGYGAGSPFHVAELLQDATFGPPSTLAALSDPDFGQPYLLIFDNLDDASVLHLVPRDGAGHVLITSRDERLPDVPGIVPVERLAATDSIALLQSYARELSPRDAGMLADTVGHLPLTLRMAGAWTRENMALLMQRAPVSAQAIASTVAQVLREQVADAGDGASTTRLVLQRTWSALDLSLQETADGRLAGRLSELTAYLSAADISLNLLRSGPMLRALAAVSGQDGAGLAADPFTFDQVIWTGVRFGIFDISWGPKGVLRIHRALQEVIRDSLSEQQRADRRSRVQSALAEYAPTAAEDDEAEQQQRLAELQHHVLACDAVSATDPAVRRWIVRQVRYMQLQQLAADSAAALKITDAALAHWPDDPADPLRGWLETERANILRWQGQYEQAQAVDVQVRQRQRRSLGPDHLRTHITGRNLGGDLRAAGNYERAKAEDGAAYEGIRQLLGEEHRHALMAAHNAALSCFLDGDVHTAMVTERDILRRRERLFGTAHPYTWWSAASLGTYQRELGDYQASRATLDAAKMWIQSVGTLVAPDEADVLRVDRSIAATTRRRGRPHVAMDEDARILAAYRRLLPAEHPDIWSSRLSWAADQHAMGESEAAVQVTRDCLDYYVDHWPSGHPFAAVCRLNLSVYLRGAKLLDEAQTQGDLARRTLRGALSDSTHPWCLAADLNRARNLLALGAVKESLQAARTVLGLCLSDLVPRHPYTQAAVHTVQVVEHVMAESPPPIRAPYLDIDIDIPQT